MNEAFAQTLAGLELALRLSLPILGAAFALGLLMSLVQAFTRLGDGALTALPRAAVTLVVLASVGGWMASELLAYAAALYRALPELTR
jgi:flagellar biosynthesis protein FliQ